jgi:hypothetical protein
MVGKTPFVGGAEPHGFREGAGVHDEDDAARTAVRPRTIPPSSADPADDVDFVKPSGGLPMWLKAVTALAALVFAVGLVVYLTRGSGGSNGATPGSASGGASGSDAGVGSGTGASSGTGGGSAPGHLAPAPPAGMLLVSHPDGTPWFFVDARPVAVGDFARVITHWKRPASAKDDDPVTLVAYTFAQAYARGVHKRLIKAEEWYAVTRVVGLTEAPADTWEWVDVEGGGQTRLVRMKNRQAMRPETAQADVTFRLAEDLTK